MAPQRTWWSATRATFVRALLLAAAAALVSAEGLRGRATAATSNTGRPAFPSDISIAEHGARGQRAVDLLGARLSDVAAWYGKTPTQFRDVLRRDGSYRLDTKGRVFVEENSVPVPRTQGNSSAAHRELDVVDGLLVPTALTFTLHSRPGASRTIYLDFDGATLTNTAWGTGLTAAAFNLDGVTGFSTTELQRVKGDAYPNFCSTRKTRIALSSTELQRVNFWKGDALRSLPTHLCST
jgi:hypothetical protein